MTTATKRADIRTDPRILKSGLTGRWYVVTRYKVTGTAPDGSDLIEARQKHDVTDYIEHIIDRESECNHLSMDGLGFGELWVCMACARICKIVRDDEILSRTVALEPDEVKEALGGR